MVSLRWRILCGSSAACLVTWRITLCSIFLGTRSHTFCMTSIPSGFQAWDSRHPMENISSSLPSTSKKCCGDCNSVKIVSKGIRQSVNKVLTQRDESVYKGCSQCAQSAHSVHIRCSHSVYKVYNQFSHSMYTGRLEYGHSMTKMHKCVVTV